MIEWLSDRDNWQSLAIFMLSITVLVHVSDHRRS